jgi:hypothetical protein
VGGTGRCTNGMCEFSTCCNTPVCCEL